MIQLLSTMIRETLLSKVNMLEIALKRKMESLLILMMDHHIVKQDGRFTSLRAFLQMKNLKQLYLKLQSLSKKKNHQRLDSMDLILLNGTIKRKVEDGLNAISGKQKVAYTGLMILKVVGKRNSLLTNSVRL